MTQPVSIQFLGAAGTVTGSKHLLSANGRRVLLDCGLFQGPKALRQRNWQPLPFDASGIHAVVLRHAHLDHSGALPLLVRQGFRGQIWCTPGTKDLLRILLLDAAHLQEEEAEYANRHGYSKHQPAQPLFRTADALNALKLVETASYGERFAVGEGTVVVFRRAGHILGSATVEVDIDGRPPLRIVFSGDLGRWGRPILRDPERVPAADVLIVESTYGDRIHSQDPDTELARVIEQTAARGGVVVVPSFAVGRTQELIWTLRHLEDEGRIPSLPTFVDSPMAIDVTQIYCEHPEDHDLDMTLLMDEKRCPLCCKQYHLVRTAAESKALNLRPGPMIVVSASGMATGGRVLHHLKLRLPDERNTVLLPGFQAAGTRGRALADGATSIRIHGEVVPVRAEVVMLDGLSAHADREELLRWVRGFDRAPSQVFVVHGEPGPASLLAAALQAELGWRANVARDGEVALLGG
jgi:metallo-beta-lactamase family protein